MVAGSTDMLTVDRVGEGSQLRSLQYGPQPSTSSLSFADDLSLTPASTPSVLRPGRPLPDGASSDTTHSSDSETDYVTASSGSSSISIPTNIPTDTHTHTHTAPLSPFSMTPTITTVYHCQDRSISSALDLTVEGALDGGRGSIMLTGGNLGPQPTGMSTYASLLAPTHPSASASRTAVPALWSSFPDASAERIPPSPTLSMRSDRSVHFALTTSLALRDNNPAERSGLSSLGLLSPSAGYHRRKPSIASSVADSLTEGRARSLAPSQFGRSTVGDATVNEPSGSNSQFHRAKSVGTEEEVAVHDDEHGEAVSPIHTQEDIDPYPFQFQPSQLVSLVDPKSLSTVIAFGGVEGLLRGLGTHRTKGLTDTLGRTVYAAVQRLPPARSSVPEIEVKSAAQEGDADGVKGLSEKSGEGPETTFAATLEDRRRVYGENVLPVRKSKSLLGLILLALKDKLQVLLALAAVAFLVLGVLQDARHDTANQSLTSWQEGTAILVSVAIVVILGSLAQWRTERQFRALERLKRDRGVIVVRDGIEQIIDVREVVVGDIAVLGPGEVIPCDGVLLAGHNIECDESEVTEQSDTVRKIIYDDCIRQHKVPDRGPADCFVLSGSKVLEGVGTYVVTAVGPKTLNGRILASLHTDFGNINISMQIKLNKLAEHIAMFGRIAALLLFTALMIRFFVEIGKSTRVWTANEKGIAFVQIFMISITMMLVAVPKGLPFAVSHALAFAVKRMVRDNLLVLNLASCETLGTVSVVCTDKTGTLTQNMMTVIAGSIGIHCKFMHDNTAAERPEESLHKYGEDFSVNMSGLNEVIGQPVRRLLEEAIAINSTAFEDLNPHTGQREFSGSKTEVALLDFVRKMGWSDYRHTRASVDIVHIVPFSSERKAMGVVVRLPDCGRYRVYVKGASEILAKKCTRHIAITDKQAQGVSDIQVQEIDEMGRDNIARTIISYANQGLRTIALCYRDLGVWPPGGNYELLEDAVLYEDLATDMTLISVMGIEDPLRPGVCEAIADSSKAGVAVKMCTGDNVLTARSIATQCGIFTAGGIIMEGSVFRQLSPQYRLEIAPRLQVLARATPEDKKLMTEALRSLGEVVGVTADGAYDGSTLKTADVGFSMGIAGTEIAKEASDIVLMDDNFASIVSAIMWGRCVNDAVRKLLQFNLSAILAVVVVTFVSAVASTQGQPALSTVQLLWISLVTNTLVTLALLTDPVSTNLLDRKPYMKAAPLLTIDMYKQIAGQAAYQAIIALIFHFLGSRILGFSPESVPDLQKNDDNVLRTMVFNIFVFAQVFNSINCRRLDKKFNIFEGILQNSYYMICTLIAIAAQICIVFFGGAAFQVARIDGRDWGISIALGFASIPLGVLIRCLPDGRVERLLVGIGLLADPRALPVTNPSADWNTPGSFVHSNMATFSRLRGSREVHVPSNCGEPPQGRTIPLAMTTLPASAPSEPGRMRQSPPDLADPARLDPSKSSTALWEGRVQLHPDTAVDDPARRRWVSTN